MFGAKKGKLSDEILLAVMKAKGKGDKPKPDVGDDSEEEETESADMSDPDARGETLVEEFSDAVSDRDYKAAYAALKALISHCSEE